MLLLRQNVKAERLTLVSLLDFSKVLTGCQAVGFMISSRKAQWIPFWQSRGQPGGRAVWRGGELGFPAGWTVHAEHSSLTGSGMCCRRLLCLSESGGAASEPNSQTACIFLVSVSGCCELIGPISQQLAERLCQITNEEDKSFFFTPGMETFHLFSGISAQ